MRKYIILFLIVLIASGIFITYHYRYKLFKNNQNTDIYNKNSSDIPMDTDKEKSASSKINKDDIYKDYSNILFLVDKQRALPSDYEPSDLVIPNVKSDRWTFYLRKEASTQLEKMFNSAKADGVNLVLISAYRSYDTQTSLFNNYVSSDGYENANKYSAKPGHSEHQTGLTVDISDEKGMYYLSQQFEISVEGIWLRENSYKFGYILRYPKGKENITGYMYEPWHFRYLGVDMATKVYESGLTYEEYINIMD